MKNNIDILAATIVRGTIFTGTKKSEMKLRKNRKKTLKKSIQRY